MLQLILDLVSIKQKLLQTICDMIRTVVQPARFSEWLLLTVRRVFL